MERLTRLNEVQYTESDFQKEKLIKRLKTKPRDFTFDEAETLLGYLTYSRSNKGKTSGSRVMLLHWIR